MDRIRSGQRGDLEKLQVRFDPFEKNYAAATRDIRTG